MNLSKLRKMHVIIIGSVLCAIAIFAQYWFLVKPKNEAYDKAKKEYDAAVVLGCAEAEQKAIADLNQAMVNKSLAEQKLAGLMARHMPDLSFGRRDIGMLQLWDEQIRRLGPLLNSFAKDPTVTSVNANFQIKPPPLSPNSPVFDAPMLQFDLGTVQVQGTSFKSLMNNVRRWSNCRRLVMVGPPAVAGQVPNLTMSYGLTCYIFPAIKGGPQSPMWGPADQASAQ